ncbi:MAG: argininosuccinate lyase [Candidatus Bathyarchaeia archaeon]
MGDILRRGRLGSARVPEVADYTSSIREDARIFKADLQVDMAHVVMLVETGILSLQDGARILKALMDIEAQGYEGLRGTPDLEDIHIVIETRLIESLTETIGGRIHTARSRNDEVATCIRWTLRKELLELMELLRDLEATLLRRAEENVETVMPGFTHTQHAQPVTMAHHLIAHFDALERDLERLMEAYARVNRSPLGAGALAGTGFPIDRLRTCELLGFDGLVENSMDAVAARDFALEVLSDLSILMCNVSRIAEELVLWSTSEFSFAELDNAYASTSSIMPQKKNPDTMEIMRAKAGRVYGNLLAALVMLKALPLTYNRDYQELTPRLWDTLDATKSTLRILRGALETIEFKADRMLAKAGEGFSTATELADTIMRETGLPFRTCHMIVAALVSRAIEEGRSLEEIDSAFLDEVSFKILGRGLGIGNEKIRCALDPRGFVESRRSIGSPRPEEVRRMLVERRRLLEVWKENLQKKRDSLAEAERLLKEAVEAIMAKAMTKATAEATNKAEAMARDRDRASNSP